MKIVKLRLVQAWDFSAKTRQALKCWSSMFKLEEEKSNQK